MYAFATPPASRQKISFLSSYIGLGCGFAGTRTSSGKMPALLDPLRRCLDVLALTSDLRVLGVILHHVARATAASGVDVLLDGGRDEVLGRGGRGIGVHVSCMEVTSMFMFSI